MAAVSLAGAVSAEPFRQLKLVLDSESIHS